MTIKVDEFAKCTTCGPLHAEGRRSLYSVAAKHAQQVGHDSVYWTIPRASDAPESPTEESTD